MTSRPRLGTVAALSVTTSVVAVGVLATCLAGIVGAELAGRDGAIVAVLAAEVAVAVLATVAVCAREAKPPVVTFGLAAAMFTIVVPLTYLGWRWSTRQRGADG